MKELYPYGQGQERQYRKKNQLKKYPLILPSGQRVSRKPSARKKIVLYIIILFFGCASKCVCGHFLDFSGEICLPQFDPEFLVTPDSQHGDWLDYKIG
jgi:hypothetical protein